MQGNLDLSSAQTSVGKRFAKVFCDAKREGLDSDFASEYALNNTYLKFVAFPDDDEYLAKYSSSSGNATNFKYVLFKAYSLAKSESKPSLLASQKTLANLLPTEV